MAKSPSGNAAAGLKGNPGSIDKSHKILKLILLSYYSSEYNEN